MEFYKLKIVSLPNFIIFFLILTMQFLFIGCNSIDKNPNSLLNQVEDVNVHSYISFENVFIDELAQSIKLDSTNEASELWQGLNLIVEVHFQNKSSKPIIVKKIDLYYTNTELDTMYLTSKYFKDNYSLEVETPFSIEAQSKIMKKMNVPWLLNKQTASKFVNLKNNQIYTYEKILDNYCRYNISLVASAYDNLMKIKESGQSGLKDILLGQNIDNQLINKIDINNLFTIITFEDDSSLKMKVEEI